MATGGASLLAFAVFSMLVMSSLGDPMPLCSDCETWCRTNCTAEAEANCANYRNGTQATARDCEGCTAGFFYTYCNPKCLKNCNNSCKKEVLPRPLCSDCETQCRSNCNAEVETTCSGTCNGGPLEGCRRQVSERCTKDGTCCSSNGTCTCDCNTVAQDSCFGVTDGYTDCKDCERGQFDQCYSTCKNNCNNSCKKKGCRHA